MAENLVHARVDAIRRLARRRAAGPLQRAVAKSSAEDIAEAMSSLTRGDTRFVFELLPAEGALGAEVLLELGEGDFGLLIGQVPAERLKGWVDELEPDDVAGNVAFIEAAGRVLRDRAGTAGFPERWATNKSLGGTDSYVFSGSRRFRDGGLPAVTMYTSAWGRPDEHPRTPGMPGESWRDRDRVEIDYDRFYHSAGDTPENTTDREPENMGWCARVGLQSALDYLGSLDADGPSRR